MRYKFKLWDKREKKWETIRNIGLYEDGSVFYIQCWDESEKDIDPPYFMDNLGVGFELVQFTGLTDKNDCEIYDGYIVWDDHKEEYGLVVLEDGEYLCVWETYTDSLCNELDYIEVIGNVFENPELLKENEE